MGNLQGNFDGLFGDLYFWFPSSLLSSICCLWRRGREVFAPTSKKLSVSPCVIKPVIDFHTFFFERGKFASDSSTIGSAGQIVWNELERDPHVSIGSQASHAMLYACSLGLLRDVRLAHWTSQCNSGSDYFSCFLVKRVWTANTEWLRAGRLILFLGLYNRNTMASWSDFSFTVLQLLHATKKQSFTIAAIILKN